MLDHHLMAPLTIGGMTLIANSLIANRPFAINRSSVVDVKVV